MGMDGKSINNWLEISGMVEDSGWSLVLVLSKIDVTD